MHPYIQPSIHPSIHHPSSIHPSIHTYKQSKNQANHHQSSTISHQSSIPNQSLTNDHPPINHQSPIEEPSSQANHGVPRDTCGVPGRRLGGWGVWMVRPGGGVGCSNQPQGKLYNEQHGSQHAVSGYWFSHGVLCRQNTMWKSIPRNNPHCFWVLIFTWGFMQAKRCENQYPETCQYPYPETVSWKPKPDSYTSHTQIAIPALPTPSSSQHSAAILLTPTTSQCPQALQPLSPEALSQPRTEGRAPF